MEPRDKKRNAWRNVLFFSIILLVFCVADLTREDIFFSESENRILAQKPRFSMESLFSGEYMKDYEEYVNDQFVSRDNWITLKTYTDILLQKKEINGVYLAKDDYLIEQHLPQDYSQEMIDGKLELLEGLVKEYPQTQVMLVPTADNILLEKLPAQAPYFDQKELLEQVEGKVGESQVINVFDALTEHAQEEIYYRTNHHWTTRGAYYAYMEWAQVNNFSPVRYPLDSLQTVTEDFRGTLYSKINLPVEGETIQMFPQTEVLPVKITYDMGVSSESFYEEKYLAGKNKYGYFLDDIHGLVEIETTSPIRKQLFVIKDSYANTMLPLLATHYEKIYVLDLRYFNGKLFDFMQSCDEYGNMDVLVLYNCIHFLEDFEYK